MYNDYINIIYTPRSIYSYIPVAQVVWTYGIILYSSCRNFRRSLDRNVLACHLQLKMRFTTVYNCPEVASKPDVIHAGYVLRESVRVAFVSSPGRLSQEHYAMPTTPRVVHWWLLFGDGSISLTFLTNWPHKFCFCDGTAYSGKPDHI